MNENEEQLEVDLETVASAQGIIELLESTIASLMNCQGKFSLKLELKELFERGV